MTNIHIFFIFIPILALILLLVNLLLAPHNPYEEKNSAFECGFHSFFGQNFDITDERRYITASDVLQKHHCQIGCKHGS